MLRIVLLLRKLILYNSFITSPTSSREKMPTFTFVADEEIRWFNVKVDKARGMYMPQSLSNVVQNLPNRGFRNLSSRRKLDEQKKKQGSKWNGREEGRQKRL